MKLLVYAIYVVIFTFCYYFLNKKLPNKWIFILYPLIFAAAIIPIKLWVNYARPAYGDAFASSWLKIILMMFAGLCVFNIAYGIVNIIVNTQVSFHQTYNNADSNLVKKLVANVSNIKGALHLFFYIGGVVLIGIAVTKY
jgi:hypothetical protein